MLLDRRYAIIFSLFEKPTSDLEYFVLLPDSEPPGPVDLLARLLRQQPHGARHHLRPAGVRGQGAVRGQHLPGGRKERVGLGRMGHSLPKGHKKNGPCDNRFDHRK